MQSTQNVFTPNKKILTASCKCAQVWRNCAVLTWCFCTRRPLTHEEIAQRRELARQRHAERQAANQSAETPVSTDAGRASIPSAPATSTVTGKHAVSLLVYV